MINVFLIVDINTEFMLMTSFCKKPVHVFSAYLPPQQTGFENSSIENHMQTGIFTILAKPFHLMKGASTVGPHVPVSKDWLKKKIGSAII